MENEGVFYQLKYVALLTVNESRKERSIGGVVKGIGPRTGFDEFIFLHSLTFIKNVILYYFM